MADQNDWSGEDIVPDGRLPGDLIVSILTNLPVKSLLKFKAVSKPWCSFISSRRFIKMHLRRQSVIANKLLLSYVYNVSHPQGLISNKLGYKFVIYSDASEQNDFSNCKIPPILSHLADDLQILAFCSGLLCLQPTLTPFPFPDPEFEGLILWNPATRKFRSVNHPPFRNLGMGYVEATNDYKIVVWNDTHTSVYSLNSDSWKKLDSAAQQFPIGRYQNKNHAFINGRMHWLTHTCTCCNAHETCVNEVISIVAFDVADEAVSCLGIPDNRRPSSDHLCWIQTLVIKGCLSVVVFSLTATSYFSIYEMEIWVMEEYGVQGSWSKQLIIQGLPAPRASIMPWNDCEIVYTNEYHAEYYFDSSEMIIFCDPFSKKKYYLEFMALSDLQVFNYVESLASVGIEEEIATFELVEV